MSWTRWKRTAAALLCLCLLLLNAGALAQSAELEAEMGYEGVVTYLRRLPVTVRVTNHGADAAGELTLDINRNESEYDRYALPLSVAAGASVSVTLPVTLTTKQDAFTLQWRVNGETESECALQPAAVLDPNSFIIGVLSQNPQNLSYMTITKAGDALKRGELWQTVALDARSFPEDVDGMRFFDLLVVDGVDGSALNDRQQAALDAWLRAGGMVVVGGGAQAVTAFPYFERYTGISAGKLLENAALSQELLDVFSLSGKPLDEPVATVSLEGAKGRAVGRERLMDVARVEGGVVVTASFSVSEKPLSSWLGKNVMWQRTLLAYAQSRYQSAMEARMYNNYSNVRYSDSGIFNAIPVPNNGGMALPMVIVAAFVAMVGFGGYFLLKKWDKNEWMWLTVPALAIGCSLLIWGASRVLELRKPIAVSYTVVQVDENGVSDSYSAVSVARPEAGRAAVRLEAGTVDLDQGYDSYYEPTGTDASAPKKLRYLYRDPTGSDVEFPETFSWMQTSFLVKDAPIVDLQISGQAEWEGEALAFSVVNHSAVALSEGVIITDYGFVSTPALLPGQTVRVKMTPNPKSITDSSQVKDGMLLNETERRLCSFYDYMNAYPKSNREIDKAELSLRQSMLQVYGNQSNWYDGIGQCYFAFADQLARIDLALNDQPVTRKGQRDMVCVKISFSPVSGDGTVRFLKGNLPVYPAEVDDRGAPHALESVTVSGRATSYRLTGEPVFAFDMSDVPSDWTLKHFDIAPRYAYFGYEVSLYRVSDGEWVNVKTHEYDANTGRESDRVTLPRLAEYVDENHLLYARFVGTGKVEDYVDIDTPQLTMDGRLN